jgi:hypothetical protein
LDVQVRLSNSIKDQSRFGYSEKSGAVIVRRDEALKIAREGQPINVTSS